LVPFIYGQSALQINSQRGTVESILNVVHGQGVAAQQGMHEAVPNQFTEKLHSARMHDDRPGDEHNLACLGADLLHHLRNFFYGSFDPALRRDLVSHEGETQPISLLELRFHPYTFVTASNEVAGPDIAQLPAEKASIRTADYRIHPLMLDIMP